MIVVYTTEREYSWGTLRSTNAGKVKIVLEGKGIEYRIERMRPGDLWKKPPEFPAKHPLGKVPYIEHDDLLIDDSTVISEYLEDAYPSPPRIAADTGATLVYRPLLLGGVFKATGKASPITIAAKGHWMMADRARCVTRWIA